MESSGSFSSDYMAEGLTSHLAVGKHPQESSWTYCSVCHNNNNNSRKGVSTCPNPDEECVLEDLRSRGLGDLFQLIGTFMKIVPKLANVCSIFNEEKKNQRKTGQIRPTLFHQLCKMVLEMFIYFLGCVLKRLAIVTLLLSLFHCKEIFFSSASQILA